MSAKYVKGQRVLIAAVGESELRELKSHVGKTGVVTDSYSFSVSDFSKPSGDAHSIMRHNIIAYTIHLDDGSEVHGVPEDVLELVA